MSKMINVVKTFTIKEGEKNGKPWKLSGVEADDAEGHPIAYPLKTFASLPKGMVEVEVEVQNHPEYGTSYMLKPVARSGNGAGQLAELTARVTRLESEVRRLSGLVDRRDPDATVGPVTAAPPRVTAGIPDDDDIPFAFPIVPLDGIDVHGKAHR